MIPFQSSLHPRMLEIQAARAEIADNARFDKAFIIMNALAAIIASYALLADSVSGVIGAMLVAMLLSPIAGVSLSLVDGDQGLFRRSLLSLGGGVGIVVVCAMIIGFLHADIIAIQFAFSIVLWFAGFHKALDRFYRNEKVVWLNVVSFALVILLFIALWANTRMVVTRILYETNTRKVLLKEISDYPGAHISDVRMNQEEGKNLVRVVVGSPRNFSAKDVGMIEAKLPAAPNGLPIELRLRHIRVEVMTKDGIKHDLHLSEAELAGEVANSP